MVLTKTLYENEVYINKTTKLLSELGLKYNKINNYLLSFVHRSLINEKPDLSAEHNERLEFLGDAVLELVVTNRLYLDFPKKTEGELTDLRSSLVKGKHLSEVAVRLGFSKHLILGKGEEASGGRKNEYLLANCVESFIGAIYLDMGYDNAKEFIYKHIYSDVDTILEKSSLKDFKSMLQEYAQAEFYITPNYNILSEVGADHDKIFTCGVYLKEKIIGKGTGSSKKKSQEDAAKNAYELIEKGECPYKK